MGTELMRACLKEQTEEFPPVPPGFESYACFTLRRIQDSDDVMSCSTSESQSIKLETESGVSDTVNVTRPVRRRRSINNGNYTDNDLEDESDFINPDQGSAKWKPEDARRPAIENTPVFYPTEEEFEDTLNYIASIRQKAEQYGICRIVPPSSWKPPCPLKDKPTWETSKFATRVQRVDKLQNRNPMRKMTKVHNKGKSKRRKCMKSGINDGTINNGTISGDPGIQEPEVFGFEPGPDFTLKTFQNYADNFKGQYFRRNQDVLDTGSTVCQDQWDPSIEAIEGEYWRIVEDASTEIEVLYGADLETGDFGSGFPKMSSQVSSSSDEKYIKSGWNLNNFPRLSGSVLSYESSDISGVLVPWLYVGMCFSSFCWHVEDHHLYSLNYMHWGAPKMWYGVAGKDALKLEEAMRNHLPDLFEEQPDLLHKLVTQLSPSVLKASGVPVYRCVQNAGEFVLTFPRAYHAGFNCGFNCAEAVNVAPVDWLPHGQLAIELYCKQGRKTSISHDKLLLGAARDAVKANWELSLLKKNTSDNLRWKDLCGKDGILARTLKVRVGIESMRRQQLCNSSPTLKMESNFDSAKEKECCVCFFDLHLSAAGCHCSPDRYACLNHANQLCSCAGVSKYFLFRYDISELNILVEALEGKLSSVYRWARFDLGLALSGSYIPKDKLHKGNLSLPSEELMQESKLVAVADSLKGLQAKEISNGVLSTDLPVQSTGAISSGKMVNYIANPKKEQCTPYLQALNGQKPQDSYILALHAQGYGVKKPLESQHDNIIVLSDNEDDESDKPVLQKAAESSIKIKLELIEENISKEDVELIKPLAEENTSKRNLEHTKITKVEDSKEGNKMPQQPDDRVSQISGDKFVSTEVVKSHVDTTNAETERSVQDSSNSREASGHIAANSQNCPLHIQPFGKIITPYNKDKHEKVRATAIVDLVGVGRTYHVPSCSQTNPDRCTRQKGPRIAKVVRRVNCNVELLASGSVQSGNLWCDSQAIFPKGFRSRVKFINVLDPANMSYYISEILDPGLDGPLFKVSLEHCPSEVFIHLSATRSWEMVREKVNQEITRQHKRGRNNLPPLQPPGSLDGFSFFGFCSPSIVQAIEALDINRVCTEYWDTRPYSRPQMQIPQRSHLNITSDDNNHLLHVGVETTLKSLFMKANKEELLSLHNLMNQTSSTGNQGLVTQLLNDEIQNRPK